MPSLYMYSLSLFVETDHEKISMVIFLHSADLFKKDYCVNFMYEVLVNCLLVLVNCLFSKKKCG